MNKKTDVEYQRFENFWHRFTKQMAWVAAATFLVLLLMGFFLV